MIQYLIADKKKRGISHGNVANVTKKKKNALL